MINITIDIEQRDWGVEIRFQGGNQFCTSEELETFNLIKKKMDEVFITLKKCDPKTVKIGKG